MDFLFGLRRRFLLLRQEPLVRITRLLHIAGEAHLFPVIQPQDLRAQLPYLGHHMRYQNGRHASLNDLLHLIAGFLPECTVSYRQHLIQNQNIRVHQAGDGKGKSGFHSGGKLLEAVILKLLELRKPNDLIVFLIQKLSRIAKKRAAKIGILPDRHVVVKAAPKLQKSCNGAVYVNLALRRQHDAGDRL